MMRLTYQSRVISFLLTTSLRDGVEWFGRLTMTQKVDIDILIEILLRNLIIVT